MSFLVGKCPSPGSGFEHFSCHVAKFYHQPCLFIMELLCPRLIVQFRNIRTNSCCHSCVHWHDKSWLRGQYISSHRKLQEISIISSGPTCNPSRLSAGQEPDSSTDVPASTFDLEQTPILPRLSLLGCHTTSIHHRRIYHSYHTAC